MLVSTLKLSVGQVPLCTVQPMQTVPAAKYAPLGKSYFLSFFEPLNFSLSGYKMGCTVIPYVF
jgi:hypothetical protein